VGKAVFHFLHHVHQLVDHLADHILEGLGLDDLGQLATGGLVPLNLEQGQDGFRRGQGAALAACSVSAAMQCSRSRALLTTAVWGRRLVPRFCMIERRSTIITQGHDIHTSRNSPRYVPDSPGRPDFSDVDKAW
jgi:hypothetical protein